MNAQSNDSKTVHRLINKQRKHGKTTISELLADGVKFEKDEILIGWNKHFLKLATPTAQNEGDK